MGSFFNVKLNEKKDRTPKPNPGVHFALVDTLSMVPTRGHGTVPKMNGMIVESVSGTNKPGDEIGDIWFVNDGDDVQKGYTAFDLMRFGVPIAGALGYPQDDQTAMQLVDELYNIEHHQLKQPARGVLVKITATPAVTGNGRNVVNCKYEFVEGQTPETIAAGRAQIDAWRAGKAVAPAATPAAAKAPAATSMLSQVPPAAAPTTPAPAARPSLLGGLLK